ncbi:Nicotinate-nucleotide pyrophosphorylase [carboxylating] [compost metagenome]|uniref:Putative pyrophosphorylase ModD n=1 Tax=Paenibacillus stellifer TaxID=169760 RepID=A0A089LMB3_9BACL|nr:ModD protein [Paenibacillus stellifer]AIQ62012.1 pyrophosphorylase [Paenibacillus stellifer]
MIYIPDESIDKMIGEDIPYLDLTTWALGIGDYKGKIEYYSREKAVLCGTEEVLRIFAKLGVSPVFSLPSGTEVGPGEVFLSAEGTAGALQMAWKVTQNLLECCSGIATKTKRVVDSVKAVNPEVSVASTRKSFPGTKALSVKAILCGGASPHRLGLSETVLVFKEHAAFCGGPEALLDVIPGIKAKAPEKKLVVETDSVEYALALCRAGADCLQFDKLPPEELLAASARLREINPGVVLLAAGGIDEHNAPSYAASGVDVLVTTALFFAKPLDMSVRLLPAE